MTTLPCRLVEPDLFFDHENEQEAKQICSGCPIKDACRTDARNRREEYGVWGGETPRERYIAICGDKTIHRRDLPPGELTDDKRERALDLRQEGYRLVDIARICGLSFRQVDNIVQRHRKEMQALIQSA